MFSLEKFYFILYANLFKHANISDGYFYPFGSTDSNQLIIGMHEESAICYDELQRIKILYQYRSWRIIRHFCFYYDQEPFDSNVAHACFISFPELNFEHDRFKVLATGEKSQEINDWCDSHNFKNWYYFFHGFAALDWYRDYQYTPQIENQFTRVFISYNRIVTKSRSYRLYFVAQLMKHNLLDHGHISLILHDHGSGTWQEELANSLSLLSDSAKLLINDQIGTLENSLTIDKENPPGHASADSGYSELLMHKSALWHVVTETVFYDDKLHLTEKIFKPITAKRPFMLMGAVGNLAYLRSYGFKTFDRWIDESYDTVTDPDSRIEMIVAELEKLCKLSDIELNVMYKEMQDILEFNFNHFYRDFKKIIIKEMLTNFENCIIEHNSSSSNMVDINNINFEQVQQLLSQ
jgi:hypothetical protein